MKRLVSGVIAVLAMALVSDFSYAQPPGGEGGEGGGRPGGGAREGGGRQGGREGGGRQGGGRGGFGGGREGGGAPQQMMAMFPLMKALDTNQDGTISSEEIDMAVVSLKKLDKDKNGKLDASELTPNFAAGRGRGGEGAGFGGGRSGQGGHQGRPQRPGEDGADNRGGDPTAFIDRMFELDENDDKKLSKDEVPERMQEMFASADADKDGFLSRSEAETFMKERMARRAEQGGQSSRGRGGEGREGGRGRGGEGGRGRGGQGGAGGEGSARRPSRPPLDDDDTEE